MFLVKMLQSLLLILTLTSVSHQQCFTPRDSLRPLNEQAKQSLLQSELQFSADLMRTVSGMQPGENLFFSPSSIFQALLMAYFSSARHTEKSLKQLLHLPKNQDKLDLVGAYTLQNYDEKLRAIESNNFTLSSSNRLYVAKGIQLQNCMKVMFAEEIQPANFAQNPRKVVRKINNWVSYKTRKVIKDFLTEDQISRDTQLVVVNAAYFKGTWKYTFDVQDTTNRKFHLSNGAVVKTPMMFQQSEFKFCINEKLSAQVLELPYAGEQISMVFLLPLNPSRNATQDLLSKLDTQAIQDTLQALTETEPKSIEVVLPKFTIEKTLDLTEVLETMGVGDLFQGSADLSTLTGRRGLSFSEATHKAKVRVDEEGTEAAAATSLIVARMWTEGFLLDHPFVYFLYDKVFHTVPFVGVYNYPEEK